MPWFDYAHHDFFCLDQPSLCITELRLVLTGRFFFVKVRTRKFLVFLTKIGKNMERFRNKGGHDDQSKMVGRL